MNNGGYVRRMSKAITTTRTSVSPVSKKAALPAMASRIRPAATKPVKTTLSDIRRAVRKSFEEHPTALDA